MGHETFQLAHVPAAVITKDTRIEQKSHEKLTALETRVHAQKVSMLSRRGMSCKTMKETLNVTQMQQAVRLSGIGK